MYQTTCIDCAETIGYVTNKPKRCHQCNRKRDADIHAQIYNKMRFRNPTQRRNPTQQRDQHLKRFYGISLVEYESMIEQQGGNCAICGEVLEYDKKIRSKINVDHDHATGKVRGILCHYCNTALGKANDDPALLRKMAEYLEKHGKTGAAS